MTNLKENFKIDKFNIINEQAKTAPLHASWYNCEPSKTFVQMMGPDGIWENFDVRIAHKYINENDAYVYLMRWDDKKERYIELDAQFVNVGLKGKKESELSTCLFIMPPLRRGINEQTALEWRKMVQQDRYEKLVENNFSRNATIKLGDK